MSECIALAVATQMAFAGATVALAQANIDCIGAVSNTTVFNVIVQPGFVCTLTNVAVLVNVEVKELSSLSVDGGILAEDTGSLVVGRRQGAMKSDCSTKSDACIQQCPPISGVFIDFGHNFMLCFGQQAKEFKL
jgi:hypothetical protein